MTTNEIIAQIIGVILIALTFFTPQVKSRNGMLFVILLANIASCAQFYFVSATAGFFALIVATIRSLVYWLYARKEKQAHILVFFLFLILQIGATILGWVSWWSF
ncbi:MAG: YgjV family protein, partial [Bacteroidales bacterium]|nr:YgjV family protein [Bacteroidales bacterium]